MRKITRKKERKQKKLLIIGSLSLLLFLCVGYAAFQTTLNITAKGNIKESPYVEIGTIKIPIVNSGDGIYEDSLENNRYIYKGQDPNNYLKFNDELWRIIAKETDGTLKVIRKEGIGVMNWDSLNNRQNDNNTYCNVLEEFNGETRYWGCNAWNAVSGNYVNGEYSGTVTQDATLNTYLNGEYYESLNTDKEYIISHDFYTGSVISTLAIQEIYEWEKQRIWNGKIGLMNVSDFLKSSTNINCNSTAASRSESTPCILEQGNYLDENKQETWTINSFGDNKAAPTLMHSGIRTVSAYFSNIKGGISGLYSSDPYLVRPVVYLKSNIVLSGDGTMDNPFIILD